MIELLILAWVLSEMSGPRPASPPATTPTTPATPPAVPPFPPPAPPIPPIVVVVPPVSPPATPPPATPPPAPPPPAPPATYTIKSGDSPFLVATKFTGQGNRWNELLAVNPSLHTETVDVPTQTKAHPEGEMVRTTRVLPFNPGQVLTLPASWPPTPS